MQSLRFGTAGTSPAMTAGRPATSRAHRVLVLIRKWRGWWWLWCRWAGQAHCGRRRQIFSPISSSSCSRLMVDQILPVVNSSNGVIAIKSNRRNDLPTPTIRNNTVQSSPSRIYVKNYVNDRVYLFGFAANEVRNIRNQRTTNGSRDFGEMSCHSSKEFREFFVG
jgi:hypothetical protein